MLYAKLKIRKNQNTPQQIEIEEIRRNIGFSLREGERRIFEVPTGHFNYFKELYACNDQY